MDRIKCIDGLRAIAVLPVILFHFGYLPNGYFGVDVFFVISGFLITGLIYAECKERQFSIRYFYLRRARRILPMVSFITVFSVIVGLFVMLPHDLDTLAQSVIATTLFSNNILQAITTKDYWNIANEFKPLMHTWSLGIEEQYYFLYPVLFLLFSARKLKLILPILLVLTVISLTLYFMPFFGGSAKFYYLPFRFFELSFGGVFAVLLKDGILNQKNSFISAFCLLSIVAVLTFNIKIIPNYLQLCLIISATCGVIVFTNDGKNFSSIILQNKFIVYIGMISFSLYMWHQVILAFTRYFILEEVTASWYFSIFVVTFVLSILSYNFIEQPFRDENKVSVRLLLSVLIPVNCLILVFCMFLYLHAGVIRDVPELDITTTNTSSFVRMGAYNDKVSSYDRDFSEVDKIHVLVIGDSFARDFVNILLESKWNGRIEISYVYDYNDAKVAKRARDASVIFYSTVDRDKLDIPKDTTERVFGIGTKSFGKSPGIFYNYRGEDYYNQRTVMREGITDLNDHYKEQWGSRFVDLIGYVADSKNTVPVFTPDHEFISGDCMHLTKAGAKYFAKLLEADQNFILHKIM